MTSWSRRISLHVIFKRNRTYLAVLVALSLLLIWLIGTNCRLLLPNIWFRFRTDLSTTTIKPVSYASQAGSGPFNNSLDDLIAQGWDEFQLKSLRYTPRNDSRYDENGTQYKVPNVVHYVWLGTDLKFTFIHYLSFISVHRYIKPDLILVYGETGPYGSWWDRTMRDVDNIYHVVRVTPSMAPSGDSFEYPAHASDLLRTQIVSLFGGIYLDADVIVLKSFNPLRHYSTVLGRERSNGLCNGIIVAEKRALFVRIVLDQYNYYHRISETWAGKSVERPHVLAIDFPELIHIEETSMHRPNFNETSKIYDSKYDWSNNYAIHLWIRLRYKSGAHVVESPDEIGCLNTTFGEIARHVYHGSKTMKCDKSTSISVPMKA